MPIYSLHYNEKSVIKKFSPRFQDDTSNQKVLIEQTRETIRLSCSLKDKVASLDSFLLQVL